MQHQQLMMKDVQWTQDLNSHTLKLVIKRTTLKKIDVMMADCVVKVTCTEKNLVKIFDLADTIDWQSKKNSIKYTNDTLEVYFLKERKAIWDEQLYTCANRQELNDRRKISLDNRDDTIKKHHEYVSSLKADHDRLSVSERMKIDDRSREITRQRKEDEKADAQKSVYGNNFVNKLDDIREGDQDIEDYDEIKDINKSQTTQVAYVETDKENYNSENQIATTVSNTKSFSHPNKASKKDNEIWNEDEIEDIGNNIRETKNVTVKSSNNPKFQPEIPKVRGSGAAKDIQENSIVPVKTVVHSIKWTEKPNPYTAVRESQFQEAPFPKFRKNQLNPNKDDEIDMKNPLWLADKGDEFVKHHDYYSAINAYSQALRIDEDMLRAKANRSACYVKLFNFFECIDDCESILHFIGKKDEFEKYKIENINMYIKSRQREAICQAWQGELDLAHERFLTLKKVVATGDVYIDPISLESYYKRMEEKRIRMEEQKKHLNEVNAMEGQARMVDKKEELMEMQKNMPAGQEKVPATQSDLPAIPEDINGEIVETTDKYHVVKEGDNSFRYVPRQDTGQVAPEAKKEEEAKEEKPEESKRKTLIEIKEEAIETFQNSDLAKGILQVIEGDIELIRKRQESLVFKLNGDKHFAEGTHDKATDAYNKALQVDPLNEKALSNLALIILKKNDYAGVIELCSKALGIILPHLEKNHFSSNVIQSSQISIGFLTKLYLRRAQAKYSLGQLEEAKDDIKNLLILDERNEPARKLQTKVRNEINLQVALDKKGLADAEFREKNFSSALIHYDESSKLLDGPESHMHLIKVLQNKSACQLQLEQFENIITTCLRGLRLISSLKNRVISFEKHRLTTEEKDNLKNFELRFLVRRANGYQKINQVYHAKSDFEESLKLDPSNKEILESQEKIKSL